MAARSVAEAHGNSKFAPSTQRHHNQSLATGELRPQRVRILSSLSLICPESIRSLPSLDYIQLIMTQVQTKLSLYRGLYREFRRVSQLGQGTAPDFLNMLRTSFSKEATPKELHDASEILLFMRSQRTYNDLLERYNPGATMTQAERTRLTARRVGLNMPLGHDPKN